MTKSATYGRDDLLAMISSGVDGGIEEERNVTNRGK
jgi:hypothetical protein